jgi:hypothetical protein
MAKESHCIFCNSKSYGKNCPWSHFKNKVHLHTGDTSKCSFCGSPTKIGPGCPHSPTGYHMGGANFFNSLTQESFIMAYVMKRLSTPIHETEAFFRGFVDANGNLLKKPETIEEQSYYTPIDAYIFKLKSLLGSKKDLLNHQIFLEKVVQNANNSNEMYQKELELKSKMDLIINRFKELSTEASNDGIPISLFEKVLIESFQK